MKPPAIALLTIGIAAPSLLGCNSVTDSLEVNMQPQINEDKFTVTYELNEDRMLMLNAKGVVKASDDGYIDSYMWELLSPQGFTLNGAETSSVHFSIPLVNSEEENQVLIEVTATDDMGATSSMITFEQDINDYLAIYVQDIEANSGEMIKVPAELYGRESRLSSLQWSIGSEHQITLFDANKDTVSFVAPTTGENNQINLKLEYSDIDGNIMSVESLVTIKP